MLHFVERELRAYLACCLLEHGFVRTVFASLRRRACQQWRIDRGQCGAVTVVQRFGDALNLNVHFHSLVLDGVYARGPDGPLRFPPLPPPEDVAIERVLRQAARRIARLLERRGLGSEADPLAEPPSGAEVRRYGTGAIPGRCSPPVQWDSAGYRVISAPADRSPLGGVLYAVFSFPGRQHPARPPLAPLPSS